MKPLHRFLQPAKIARKSVLSLMCHDITFSLLMVALIYGTQYIVRAIEIDDTQMFNTRVLLLIAIAVAMLILKTLRKPRIFTVFRDLRDAIDTISLPKIIQWDNNIYEGIGTGRMIAIYGKGTQTRWEMLANLFGDMLASIIFFIAFLVTAYQKDPNMLWGSLIMLGLLAIRFRLVGHRQYKWRRIAKDRRIDINRLQVRWFMSKYEIMQQGKIEQELSKRYDLNERRYQVKFKEKVAQWVAFDGSIFIATLLFVMLIWYAGRQVLAWNLWYGDIVVIIWLGSALIKDLDHVMRLIRIMVDKWIDVEKLWDLSDKLKTDYDINEWEEFIYRTGHIDFDWLMYGYHDDEPIFENLSLSIAWGKRTALVGVSGSGKSTLVKLIAGYLRPDGGSMKIDGQDITTVSLKSYYKHIGYLTQEPNVFDGTIIDNLTYALDEEVSDERIEEIVKLANCEFVYDLPLWLETEIGERGIRLSGGQRQRLAIAKVFLKNPEIIILDEPTSALDSFSEDAITDAMHNLFENRTVIIIAHRLQTVKQADDIIVLDKWQIIERGTHESLVATWGAYAKMLELQSGF